MQRYPTVLSAFAFSTPFVNQLSFQHGPSATPEAAGIEDICDTLWQRRGKRLRPHLVYWFGQLAEAKPADLDLYAWAAEAIHTATLLHDDVIDEAKMRRGSASANSLYDNTLPVLSGDYLIIDVMQQIVRRGHPELLSLLCQTLKDLCCGEFLQYELKYTIPQANDIYLQVTQLKTTALFSWCAQVGPVLTAHPARSPVTQYIQSFGQLFQLSDDVLDIAGAAVKDKWNDLKEGKLNRITWELVQNDPALYALTENNFSRKKISDALLQSFANHAGLPQLIEQAKKQLGLLAAQAKAALAPLPDCPIKQALADLPELFIARCEWSKEQEYNLAG